MIKIRKLDKESCRGLFQVNNIVLGGERVNIKNSKFFAESWNVAIRKKERVIF